MEAIGQYFTMDIAVLSGRNYYLLGICIHVLANTPSNNDGKLNTIPNKETEKTPSPD